MYAAEWPCCHDPLRFSLGSDDLLPRVTTHRQNHQSRVSMQVQWAAPQRLQRTCNGRPLDAARCKRLQCIGAAPQNTWNGKFGLEHWAAPRSISACVNTGLRIRSPEHWAPPQSFLVQGSVLPSRSAVRCIGQPLIVKVQDGEAAPHWAGPSIGQPLRISSSQVKWAAAQGDIRVYLIELS